MPWRCFFALLGLILGAWLGFSFGGISFVWLVILSIALLVISLRKKEMVVFLFCLALTAGATQVKFPIYEGNAVYVGFVVEAKANYFIFSSGGNRYYVYESESIREEGDYLSIYGTVSSYKSTHYESRFDFQEYLRRKGITHSLRAYEIQVKWERPIRLASRERNYLANYSLEAKALISSLLFSRSDYSDPLIQNAAGLGIIYFLSSSGMLLGVLIGAAEKLLKLKFSDREAQTSALLFGMLFVPFLGLKVGIARVVLTRLLNLWKSSKSKSPSRFSCLSISGIILIFGDWHLVLSSAFLVGYGLSFAMALSQEIIARFSGWKKRLCGGVIVHSFLFPMLAIDGSIHPFGFLFGSFLIPLVVPFVFLALAGFFTVPFAGFLNGYASSVGWCLTVLAKIDVTVSLGWWGLLAVFIYLLLLCVALYCIECGFPKFASVIALTLVLAVSINAMPFGQGFTSSVSFINVGQGDAILIRDGYKTVLIDTGGSLSFDMAQEVDIPYLRKEKIAHIDCLIASHGDYDHIGAKDSLIKNFPVRKYVDDPAEFPLTVGSLTFVNYNVYSGSDENEESLVLSVRLMEKTWLFTGDAPSSVEKKIVKDHPELNCDVLKVGHHGSATSSSLAFLKSVSPETAIVSVGATNRYGHPSDEVIARLCALDIEIRRTDLEGTIRYVSFRGKPPFGKWFS
jgi:competence protein ComEC